MTCKSAFVFSNSLLDYHFHKDHPFNQIRVQLTKELLEATGTLNHHDIIPPRMASDSELALFHEKSYIEAVKRANQENFSPDEKDKYGIGTEDTPIFAKMHEASSYLVGGTLAAVDAVLDHSFHHALHLGGGLHHGFKNRASGFCVYNDGAVAIKYIQKKYNAKVLYVDTDAHHGDGVQAAFYDDPTVCTLSIHETGRYLFPGTGEVKERGIKSGHGYTFNIPIDAFTQDASFLDIYKKSMQTITKYFKPDVIVTQNGADAHFHDPLTHLSSSMKTFEIIPLIAHDLAHEYCNGRWIALGGGGYDIWRVVPRAWAQIWNVMKNGQIKKGNLPHNWLNKWQKKSPHKLPKYWHDLENDIPHIPRKAEIEEKNQLTLKAALTYARE